MTKAELVELIAQRTGVSKKDTGIVGKLILENIGGALTRGDKVELRGFGSFKVKSRRPRQARNPRTGNSVAVHEAQFAVSAHKKLDCVGCHTAALGVKHKGKRQPLGPVSFDVCMECHEDEITPFQGSVHAPPLIHISEPPTPY